MSLKNVTRSSKKSKPKTKARKIPWVTVGKEENKRFGKNIALVGQPMAGKTVFSMLYGYFNSKYKEHIREAGFEFVAEALDIGLLAEIEKIIVIESENNLEKAINDGVEKALFAPLIKQEMIEIRPIKIPRKETAIRDGKVVNVSKELIEMKREQYKETVKEIVDDYGEGTLFILDSATKFKKLLDDRLGNILDTVENRAHASVEGLDKFTQVFYSHRNTEWENLMEYKRGFGGWNIDTFKESVTPQHYVEKGADRLNTKWVNGTEHFLDVAFRIQDVGNRNYREVSVVDNKARCLPMTEERLKPFRCPTNSRLGAMPMIDRICEKLLLGEKAEDELDLWSA